MSEHPNILSGLISKRAELAKYRDHLEADIRVVTVDIDHLEAAIHIFDPEAAPAARRRYAALNRAPKGQSTRFVLERLRTASEPLTCRSLANMWCADRGLAAAPMTVSLTRKRIGDTLKALHNKGMVQHHLLLVEAERRLLGGYEEKQVPTAEPKEG